MLNTNDYNAETLVSSLEDLTWENFVDLSHVFGTGQLWFRGNKDRPAVARAVRRHWKAMGRTERLAVWFDEKTFSPTVRLWDIRRNPRTFFGPEEEW
jgi:hypothetical protein